jgi:hypothetical protein
MIHVFAWRADDNPADLLPKCLTKQMAVIELFSFSMAIVGIRKMYDVSEAYSVWA